MYDILIEDSFSASHFLRHYQGKCERLHGHNYRVEIVIQAAQLDPIGMGVDFTIAKQWLKEVLSTMDHQHLNEVEPFLTENPSAENIARFIYHQYQTKLTDNLTLSKVTVGETDRNKVSYWE